MPTLLEILQDPNYTSANEETKRAIFMRWAPQDPNYTNANAETKAAIRQRFGITEAPATPPGQIPGAGPYVAPPAQAPSTARRLATGIQENVAGMAQALQPTAEMAGAFAGAAGGAQAVAPLAVAAGPFAPAVTALGGIAGGAAGYAGARGTAQALQGERPELGASVTEGAIGETAGRVLGPVLGAAARPIARAIDFLRSASQRTATTIAQQAAGPELPNIIEQLRTAVQAGSDLTPAQVTAATPRQAFQTMLSRNQDIDEATRIARQQVADAEKNLARMAGGANQTAAEEALRQAKKDLNALTKPQRETELAAANEAQRVMNRLLPMAEQRQQSMISALREGQPMPVTAPQQGGLVRGTVTGEPRTGQSMIVPTAEAARLATLARQAEGPLRRPDQVTASQQDATARFLRNRLSALSDEQRQTGEVFANIAAQRRAERDFIQRQIGSLEAYGLRPLDIRPIIDTFDNALKSPGTYASPTTVKVITALRDDLLSLAQRNGGVIDAEALYTFRKEGVSQRIQDIVEKQDPKIGSKITASVLEKMNPLIDRAIERAGGTGWKQYLETYSKGMDVINQRAMAAQALELFQNSPDAYVKLVRGNNKDAVEAIFGPGRFSIFKEMSEQMPTLERIATRIEADRMATAAAGRGQEDYLRILQANQPVLRLPNWFDPTITAINAALTKTERKLSDKTLKVLRDATKSNRSMLQLLEGLPQDERTKLIDIMNAKSFGPAARAVGTTAIADIVRELQQ
jgi:hypothetical protein